MIRLNKWLAEAGVDSRRHCDQLIRLGRVAINGKRCSTLGVKIDPLRDSVAVDGKPVLSTKLRAKFYFALNKPVGVVTTASDPESRETIFDLPSVRRQQGRLFSVGRLDFNTSGLLLLTNDGELTFKLSHPRHAVLRKYHVRASRRLTEVEISQAKSGIRLIDGRCSCEELLQLKKTHFSPRRGYWYEVGLREGRNRIVRRIFEYFGIQVEELIRIQFGSLRLDPFQKPGDLHQLSSRQLAALKRAPR